MKATDLRIGNLVLYKGEIVTVFALDKAGASAFRINHILVNKETGASLGTGAIDFNPIPITPEWLVNFGFDARGDFIDITCDEGLDSEFTIQMDQGEIYLYTWTDDRVRLHLKFVHQLQNLYFALSGRELALSQ